jgi:hypothetical protein
MYFQHGCPELGLCMQIAGYTSSTAVCGSIIFMFSMKKRIKSVSPSRRPSDTAWNPVQGLATLLYSKKKKRRKKLIAQSLFFK